MIELKDIVFIKIFRDGHTGFWLQNGTWACSCGEQWWTPDNAYQHAAAERREMIVALLKG